MLTIDPSHTHIHTPLISDGRYTEFAWCGDSGVMLCDCFSFTEGFTSCCHTNAACGFGTCV